MKISVNWMQWYAGSDVKIMPDGGIDELVASIGAQLGAVEEVVDLGARYQGIIVAQVVSCVKHENADKLNVCLIDDGGKAKGVDRNKDGYVQVVCGAPNVREGLLVAWLPPGSTVPSSFVNDPFVLEARELRGVVSNGMLASAHELAISDDHAGLLELEQSDGVSLKPGDDFAETFGLNDYIIDIENKMFTHRPDCFGQLGVAREIAGITGQKFISPVNYLTDKTQEPIHKNGLHVKIDNQIPELVPRFMAQVFQDITVGPSPVWMQTYLMRCDVRPINNIVDITNYFMLLTGQPMHAYDYDKVNALSGKDATIVVRKPKKGEKIKLLNGKEIEPWADAIMIATDKHLIGVGGVMGGSETEVDDQTKNIILESANFNMYAIRRTAMQHGLFTDAVTRFNKGQSPLQCDRVMAWAASEIICQTGGIVGNVYDEHRDLSQPKAVRVAVSFINDRLGLELTRDAMAKLLTNVEFDVELTDNTKELKVTPPFWRTDIEIPEDLVEEVGRLYGFDYLPLVLPIRSLTPTKPDELLTFKQQLRDILARAGANEVLNYSFVHGNLLQKSGQDSALAFKLSNAISPDLQYYRMSLTPSLLDKVHMNIKAGYDNFALFEINKVHNKLHADDDIGLPTEIHMISLVYAANDKLKKPAAAYYEARAFLDNLAQSLGLTFEYTPIDKAADYPVSKPFDADRSAMVHVKGTDIVLGMVGEYGATVRKGLKLPAHSAGFEIGTLQLMEAVDGSSSYQQIPRFPKISQDISLKVPADIAYTVVYDVLSQALLGNPDVLAALQPLDIYQRDDDSDHKQLSFRFTVASFEKTLKSEEINALLDKAAVVAAEKFGAERI